MILCGTRSTPFPENFWEISHFETSFEGQPSIQNLVQTIMWPNSNGQKTNNKNLKIMSLPTCKSVFESYSMYHLNHHKSQDQKFIDTKTNVKWQTLEEFYLAAFQTLCDRPGPWPPDEDKNNGWDWCRLVSRKVTASIYYNINIPIFLSIFYLDCHQISVHVTIHTRSLCHVQKPLPWASTR